MLSSTYPPPSHFLIFPSAFSHPAPYTSVRGSCTIPWELQVWPRITQSTEGSSDQKSPPLPSAEPAYPTRADWLQPLQPWVLVLVRTFLSLRPPERDNGQDAPREHQRSPPPSLQATHLQTPSAHSLTQPLLIGQTPMSPIRLRTDWSQSTLAHGKPFFFFFLSFFV